MAYQSLYRRYRSRRFAEVLGQDQVVGALRNAVREDRVGHAYLFSGPRGTGKTSTARILAKALNCTNLQDGEPCCECESCVSIEAGTSYDLQELDAASNNKVENVRDLIERVALGSPGRTKVYILDEVHMLSAGASNALLKTLEEPPPHVVFVLATTDPHKMLPTIRSRTQHFEFHLLPADILTEHVRFVIKDAGLNVSDEAIEHVVRQGGGSARDTLSALDQVAAAGGVAESQEHAEALIDAVCAHDTALALKSVADAVGAGRDPRLLGEVLLARLRDAFLVRMGAPLPQATDTERERAKAWAAQLTDRSTVRALEEVGAALLEMRQAPDARIPLEVALVRITRPPEPVAGDLGPLLERIERLEKTLANGDHATIERRDETFTATPPPTLPPKAREPDSSGSAPPPAKRARPGDAARALLSAKAAADPSVSEPAVPAPPSGSPPPPPVPPTSEPTTAAGQADQGPAHAVASAATNDPASAKDTLDADAFLVGWAEILDRLTGMTGAMYRTAVFANIDGDKVTLSVANDVQRQRSEQHRPKVEAALNTHFGRPITLSLVTDGSARPPVSEPVRSNEKNGRPPATAANPARPSEHEDELIDVSELEDAPDARTGVDRVTDAFPGAELLPEDPKP